MRALPERAEQGFRDLLAPGDQVTGLGNDDDIAQFFVEDQGVVFHGLPFSSREKNRARLKDVTLFEVRAADHLIPRIIHRALIPTDRRREGVG